MKNYYFKFGYSNNLFENLLKEKIKMDNMGFEVGNNIDLAIFFNKTFDNENWTVEDWKNDEVTSKKDSNYEQIDCFLKCPDTESYLWIFNKGKVYVFKPKSQPWDGNAGYYDQIKKINGKDYEGERPKFIKFKIIRIFKNTVLPESFSTINANQKYNRKTIKQLEGIENEVASHLVINGLENEKMKIPIGNKLALEYLSPIQFETLIFLIFHHNNCFVTTYRGGTRPDIDLVFEPYEDFLFFNEEEKYEIQIKKYDLIKLHPRYSLKDKDYLIHLGDTIPDKNIIGKQWIEEQLLIDDRISKEDRMKKEHIKKWLKKSLDFFTIVD